VAGGALVAGAGHLGQGVDLDGMPGPGCAGAGRPGSWRPRVGRSRRCAASGHAGDGSRSPAAARRPCESARPRPPPAWAAGPRPRRTGPTQPRSRGRRGAGWRRRVPGSYRPPDAAHAPTARLVAEQPVPSDQAPVFPAAQDLAQGLLAQLSRDLWDPGRQSAEQDAEDIGPGGVLLAEPGQGGRIPLGDPDVNVPTRTPGVGAARPGAVRWSVAVAVDPRAGSDAAGPKEALVRHRGPPPLGGRPPLGVLAQRPGGSGTRTRRRR
jgi:hypothetical protein